SGNYDLWKVPVDGAGHAACYQSTPAQERGAALSPDDHWLVYSADEGDSRSVYVQSFPEPGTKYQITVADAAGATWTHDGAAILVITRSQDLLRIPVTLTGGFRQGATTHLFTLPMTDFLTDIQVGERRFLTSSLIDLSASTQLELVFDWTRLLGTQ
ncbi:MAG TPA: hypothetical protein VLV15_08245, partial [Dongiaceae bacterium]|nr:hypothetical protein [Dongiaceae bacterium]